MFYIANSKMNRYNMFNMTLSYIHSKILWSQTKQESKKLSTAILKNFSFQTFKVLEMVSINFHYFLKLSKTHMSPVFVDSKYFELQGIVEEDRKYGQPKNKLVNREAVHKFYR